MRCPSCGEAAVDPGEGCPECGKTVERPAADGTGTSLGLDRNVAAVLAYSLTFASGLLFYVLEDDAFVRFHAAQSVLVFGAAFGLALVLEVWQAALVLSGAAGGTGPRLLTGVSTVLGLVTVGLWTLLMVQAYRGERFAVALFGRAAAASV
jgi:uncharacterized membrane protein